MESSILHYARNKLASNVTRRILVNTLDHNDIMCGESSGFISAVRSTIHVS